MPTETSGSDTRASLWAALGPGILFAGAAVGVSHLVQSTRAGANYGLALIGFVLLANAMKYPAFRFGPMYAAATGTSMLEGYRRRGRSALVLYGLLTLATMFTVQAAVTFVAAGLLLHVTGWALGPVSASAGLTALCVLLLTLGRYQWLDLVTKVAVAIFTVATLVATAMALGELESFGPLWPGDLTTDDWLFVVALVGWMPSAIDVSVWQSLWTLARARTAGLPSMRASSIDFHVGYVGCAVLAVCFVLLGAAVMHGRDVAFDPRPAVFAGQLVDLYGETLGAWSAPVIGVAALLVMFSTTLAVVDGFPRAIAVLVARWRTPERPFGAEADGEPDPDQDQDPDADPDPDADGTPGTGTGTGTGTDPGTDTDPDAGWAYWIAITVLAAGSLAILQFAVTSLKALIDIATTASFVTAPVLSWLNHRAITGAEVPEDRRPARWLLLASLAGIALQGAFALLYGWITLAP